MQIGTKVQVRRIRDRVGQEVADTLGKVGTITEFKMTDGSGVGAYVKFADETTVWFFEDELQTVG